MCLELISSIYYNMVHSTTFYVARIHGGKHKANGMVYKSSPKSETVANKAIIFAV